MRCRSSGSSSPIRSTASSSASSWRSSAPFSGCSAASSSARSSPSSISARVSEASSVGRADSRRTWCSSSSRPSTRSAMSEGCSSPTASCRASTSPAATSSARRSCTFSMSSAGVLMGGRRGLGSKGVRPESRTAWDAARRDPAACPDTGRSSPASRVGKVGKPGYPAEHAGHEPLLEREHRARCPLLALRVVVAEHVERSVDGQPHELLVPRHPQLVGLAPGLLHPDVHVPQGCVRRAEGEGEHVGRAVPAEVPRVQLADAVVVQEGQRDLGAIGALLGQRRAHRTLEHLRRDVVEGTEVDLHLRLPSLAHGSASSPGGASPWACPVRSLSSGASVRCLVAGYSMRR